MTDAAQPVSTQHADAPKTTTNRSFLGFARALKRFFWMGEQVAAAIKEGYGPGQPGWEEFRLARAAANDMKTMGETGDGLGSALLLNRAAIILLTRAHLARLGVEAKPTATGDECWTQFIEQPTTADLASELTITQRGLLTSVLGVQGELFLAQQSEEQRKNALTTLSDIADKLAAPFEVDAKRVQNVLFLRWAKISVLAVAVLAAVGGAWQMCSDRPRPNLALHRQVTVSSMHHTWGKDPSQLVDGNRTELGMHTLEGANQNATIDLGRNHRISRVVVYNRTDCCQERAVPLRIEVSEDGKQFKKVAERNEPFEIEWKANFFPTSARYVRLTDLSANFFHLNEVEVY